LRGWGKGRGKKKGGWPRGGGPEEKTPLWERGKGKGIARLLNPKKKNRSGRSFLGLGKWGTGLEQKRRGKIFVGAKPPGGKTGGSFGLLTPLPVSPKTIAKIRAPCSLKTLRIPPKRGKDGANPENGLIGEGKGEDRGSRLGGGLKEDFENKEGYQTKPGKKV